MKFRWRSWLVAGGLNIKVVRRVAQSRINDNLWIIYSGTDFNGGLGYSVDLQRRTMKIWRNYG